jgi:mannose-6-phosphate isomerase-like protein (cupin superfamily)
MKSGDEKTQGSRDMTLQKALFIRLSEVASDPEMQAGSRGLRRVLVTSLYPETETHAKEILWQAPSAGVSCPVQVMQDLEAGFFTQDSTQVRHYHENATEIYISLKGEILIEVEGLDYRLNQGDMLVVNPMTAHQVKQGRNPFLGLMIAHDSRGSGDKVVLD